MVYRVNNGFSTQAAFPLSVLLGKDVTVERLFVRYFTGTGKTETLFGATFGFHFWHKDRNLKFLVQTSKLQTFSGFSVLKISFLDVISVPMRVNQSLIEKKAPGCRGFTLITVNDSILTEP
jgi:hypothetical protein